MKLDFEGNEDSYTFVEAGELRALVERLAGENRLHSNSAAWRRGGRYNRDFYGRHNYASALNALTFGDESLVVRSDDLLSKLEDKLPHTKKFQLKRSLVGGLVCVPEFLTGNPECMRIRRRVERNDAPVTIVMDLTASASVTSEQLLARGIAILALARALCEHRAVELWGAQALGNTGWSHTLLWHIETSPLDLARAAFML